MIAKSDIEKLPADLRDRAEAALKWFERIESAPNRSAAFRAIEDETGTPARQVQSLWERFKKMGMAAFGDARRGRRPSNASGETRGQHSDQP